MGCRHAAFPIVLAKCSMAFCVTQHQRSQRPAGHGQCHFHWSVATRSFSMCLHAGFTLPCAFLPGFLSQSGFPAMWHCFDASEPGFALQAGVTESAFSKHPSRQPPDNDKSWFIASPKASQCFLTDILAVFSHPSLLKPDVKQPRKAVHSHQTI